MSVEAMSVTVLCSARIAGLVPWTKCWYGSVRASGTVTDRKFSSTRADIAPLKKIESVVV
jgi:hypothetical protein